MDYKSFSLIKNINLSTTVFYSVFTAIMAVKTIWFLLWGTRIGQLSGKLLDLPEYEEDSLTGGYEALFRIFGGGFGVLVAIAMILAGLGMLLIIAFSISMIVSGVRFGGACKGNGLLNWKKMRNSNIYKIVINSLFLLGSIIVLSGHLAVVPWICMMAFLTFEILLIVALVKMPKMP